MKVSLDLHKEIFDPKQEAERTRCRDFHIPEG